MAEHWLEKVDVEDFLEVLEMENMRPEGRYEMRFSCPYPAHENGDRNASAYMNKETTQWHCHGCKRGGDAISFASSILGISPIKAKRMLRQAYAPETLDPDKRVLSEEIRRIWREKKQNNEPVNVPIPPEVNERFALDWEHAYNAYLDGVGHPATDYMFERGFEWETMEYWGIGYDERTNRVTIPIVDEKQQLVGFKGRAIDDRHPKYLSIGDARGREPHYGWPTYHRALVLFGLHEAIMTNIMGDPMNDDVLIVCEGELNAIAMWQMGYRNSIAILGSGVSTQHVRLMKAFGDKLILLFDPDAAGDIGLNGYTDEKGRYHPGALDKLQAFCDISIVRGHDEDPADMLKQGRETEVDSLVQNAIPLTLARVTEGR